MEHVGSARDVLVNLFSLCDDWNPVNYGSSDEAADEVIRVLKEHGYLIVSNTPCLIPVNPPGDPNSE